MIYEIINKGKGIINSLLPENLLLIKEDGFATTEYVDEQSALKEDKSNKGIVNGYAPLNADNKVPDIHLPITAIPTLHQVLNAGNNSPNPIVQSFVGQTTTTDHNGMRINQDDYSGSTYLTKNGFVSSVNTGQYVRLELGVGLEMKTGTNNGYAKLKSDLLSENKTLTFQYPNKANGTYTLATTDDVNVKIGGTGTANKLAKFTSAGTLGDSSIIDLGYAIAINTPTAQGAITALSSITGFPLLSIGHTNFVNDNNGFGHFAIGQEANGDVYFGLHALRTFLNLKRNGNVLIGSNTDNGVDKLQVNGSGYFSGDVKLINNGKLDVTTTPGSLGIRINDYLDLYGYKTRIYSAQGLDVLYGNFGVFGINAKLSFDYANYITNRSSDGYMLIDGFYGLKIASSGVDKFAFKSSGAMLVNTAVDNGEDKLQVNGSGYFIGDFKTNGKGRFLNGVSNFEISAGIINGSTVLSTNGHANQIFLGSGGDVSIGTYGFGGGAKLQVAGKIVNFGEFSTAGGNSGFIFDTYDNLYGSNLFMFKTQGVTKLTLSAIGNLLLNTTTDNGTDKLQVNGTGSFLGLNITPTDTYGGTHLKFNTGYGSYTLGSDGAGTYAGLKIKSGDNTNIKFQTNGSTLFGALSDNNSGSKVQITGGLTVTALSETAPITLGYFQFYNAWSSKISVQGFDRIQFDAGSNGAYFFGQVRSVDGFFTGNTNLTNTTVIGGSSTGAKLWAYDGIQFDNRSYYNAPTTFSFNTIEKARFSYTGNLLLNKTDDNGVDKLQVNGSILGQTAKLDKLYLKSSSSNPDLSAIIAISKNITAATAHVIEDSSTITPPIGADGYGIVDVITTLNGTNPTTHLHSFQSRLRYSSSANMPTNNFSSITSFYSENQILGTGVVDKVIGFKAVDTFTVNANKVNKQYGVLIENLTVGTVNYGMWNDTRGNYIKGLSIGTQTIDLDNTLSVTGSIKATSSVQVGDNTTAASVSNVGAMRYRESGNNSYSEMCMRTGSATYAWIVQVENNW